jgi:hypothetical protein
VTWKGGRLDAHQFTDFGLSMQLPDAPGETVHFPAIQRCAEGQTRWIQIPVEGEPEPDEPAPGVVLIAEDGGHGGGTDDAMATDGGAGAEDGGDGASVAGSGGSEQAAAPIAGDGGDGEGGSGLAIALGAAGLAAGLTALGLVLARRPRSA